MVSFNVVFGCLAIISGLGNIYVGTLPDSNSFYTTSNFIAASIQIILASIMVITGLAKLNKLVNSDLLAKLHIYSAVVFYIFGFSSVFYMYNKMFG